MDKRRMPRRFWPSAARRRHEGAEADAEWQGPEPSGLLCGARLARADPCRSRGIGKHRKATKEERIAKLLRYTLGASEGFQRSKHWAWTPA